MVPESATACWRGDCLETFCWIPFSNRANEGEGTAAYAQCAAALQASCGLAVRAQPVHLFVGIARCVLESEEHHARDLCPGHHGVDGEGLPDLSICPSSHMEDLLGRHTPLTLLRTSEEAYAEIGRRAGVLALDGGGTCGRRSLSKALVTATKRGETAGMPPAADALWARRWIISSRVTEGYTMVSLALHYRRGLSALARTVGFSVGTVRCMLGTRGPHARGLCTGHFVGTPTWTWRGYVGNDHEEPYQKMSYWVALTRALQDPLARNYQGRRDDLWNSLIAGHRGADGVSFRPNGDLEAFLGKKIQLDLFWMREEAYGEHRLSAGVLAPGGDGTCGRRSLSKALVTAIERNETTGENPAADALWARRWTTPRRGKEGDLMAPRMISGTRGRRPLGKALVYSEMDDGTGVVPAADAHWARRWTTPRQNEGSEKRQP